ncbi:hypothetical protein ACO0OL_000500 [Hanseniaspora opuntiae]
MTDNCVDTGKLMNFQVSSLNDDIASSASNNFHSKNLKTNLPSMENASESEKPTKLLPSPISKDSSNSINVALKRSLDDEIDSKDKKKPKLEENVDDFPLKTDYGSLDDLLQEIGLPNTKATGLYDDDTKPPYSYAAMIALSIMVSGMGQLTLSQIYQWISAHFPFYKLGDSGWQNSIRHNLSLNNAFFKAGKSSDGKGHFWRLTPGQEYKILKIQAKPSSRSKMKKVPFDTTKMSNPPELISSSTLTSNDVAKEDDTLVNSSSNSSVSSKEKERVQNATQTISYHENREFGSASNVLATPMRYISSAHCPVTADAINNLKIQFDNGRNQNDNEQTYVNFNEQPFQCSFNTSFESPKMAPNIGSSPLIECHSRKNLSGSSNIKASLGRATGTAVETPCRNSNMDYDDNYNKLIVGNVMLSRTPLKPVTSPLGGNFSSMNNLLPNSLNLLQRQTPRWNTPSYDDLFASPFFKSPSRSHHFGGSTGSNFLYSEQISTIHQANAYGGLENIDNALSEGNLYTSRKYSDTGTKEYVVNSPGKLNLETPLKHLEPALMGLKSKGSNTENTEDVGI